MTELGVNVDHVATVREARGIDVPDPVKAAYFAEQSGADGITIHLRKDRRHIQERDVRLLKETVKSRLNLEMANTDEMRSLAREFKPRQITLVPEERDEVTTEGGLDVVGNREHIQRGIHELKDTIPTVSLFVDPDEDQLEASREVGADAVELHTGDYAETEYRSDERRDALNRLERAAHHTESIGLTCFAGHGLNYRNVQPVAALKPVEELNIGHALVSRALMVGFEKATRQMKELMREATVK
jgi:pyridoxine 5-phosphate synthase